MFILFLLISVTNFVVNSIEQNDCGCNIRREQGNFNNKYEFLKSFKASLLEQCPIQTRETVYTINDSSVKNDLSHMILVPQGEYQIGTDDILIEGDNEGPRRIVKLNSFYLDKYEVSNTDYEKFVLATGYKSEAEVFGDSFVFTLFLNSSFKESLVDYRVVQAPWWYKVTGTDWRHPHGPDSDIKDVMNHPVIHVSWRDAQAYCRWREARLPTEAEWEAACRGGQRDTKYPWGDKLFPDRIHMANIWQGTFPNHNSKKDGYIGTNPVDMFPPQNEFGFHNLAGNVWEWTADEWTSAKPNEKVKKGGSYLCHRSYCYRYRCSARSQNTEDSTAGNLGFRCAKSL